MTTTHTALREYVGALVNQGHHADHDWQVLLTADHANATLLALKELRDYHTAKAADRRAELSQAETDLADGRINAAGFAHARAEHRNWCRRARHFETQLRLRVQQATEAVKEHNRNRAGERAAQELVKVRRALASAAVAIHDHKAATTDPSSADEELWHYLDVLTVSFQERAASLAELVETGVWTT